MPVSAAFSIEPQITNQARIVEDPKKDRTKLDSPIADIVKVDLGAWLPGSG